MSRYWRFQTLGWGTLLAIDFTGKYAANIFTPSLLAAVAVLYILGLVVSQGMRNLYKRFCTSLSIPKVLPIAFFVSLVGAILSSTGLMGYLYLIEHKTFINENTNPLQIYTYNIFLMWLFLGIWTALYFFITRQRQVDNLSQEQHALQKNLEQSQIHALMNQLNPHFMFNCINNIRALILEDKNKARDMLAHMADMLRYNLQDQHQATESLQKELDIGHAFMQLASIQLEDRLTYQTDIDPDLDTNTQLPRMLIQLLLENAIKHGIGLLPKGGEVKLQIYKHQQQLYIIVSNHGQLATTQKPHNTGIGLTNIQNRLTMIYQQRASFSIKQDGELVIAETIIPLEDTCE